MIQAQSFVLVDAAGAVKGTFAVSPDGTPTILLNDQGRTVSLYPPQAEFRPLTSGTNSNPAPFTK
jgi:hypothetical protein